MNKEKLRELNEKIDEELDLIRVFVSDRIDKILEYKNEMLEERDNDN